VSDALPDPLPAALPPRRYTVTHNDITGHIALSIGEDFDVHQISGWYTRLVRDEVCAEWSFAKAPSLHLYCHVSGATKWLAPPRYRNYIFKREMPLVLDSILYAERNLLGNEALWLAPIFIHFEAAEVRLPPPLTITTASSATKCTASASCQLNVALSALTMSCDRPALAMIA
jgi:hypothetical protein